jgi:hypothetical protein
MEVRIYFERTDGCAKDPIQGGVVSDNPEQLDRELDPSRKHSTVISQTCKIHSIGAGF